MNRSLNLEEEGDRLVIALQLYQRFCHDLASDSGQARTRLVAGIQIALRDAAWNTPAEQPFPISQRPRGQGEER